MEVGCVNSVAVGMPVTRQPPLSTYALCFRAYHLYRSRATSDV